MSPDNHHRPQRPGDHAAHRHRRQHPAAGPPQPAQRLPDHLRRPVRGRHLHVQGRAGRHGPGRQRHGPEPERNQRRKPRRHLHLHGRSEQHGRRPVRQRPVQRPAGSAVRHRRLRDHTWPRSTPPATPCSRVCGRLRHQRGRHAAGQRPVPVQRRHVQHGQPDEHPRRRRPAGPARAPPTKPTGIRCSRAAAPFEQIIISMVGRPQLLQPDRRRPRRQRQRLGLRHAGLRGPARPGAVQLRAEQLFVPQLANAESAARTAGRPQPAGGAGLS